jgi:hypothetical protein
MSMDLDMKAVDDMELETTTDQDMKADETSDEDEEGAKRPKFGEGLWGFGPPLGAQGHGQVKRRWFADGAGLCSPGRWAPASRTVDQSGLSANLRMRLVRLLHEHCDVKKVVFTLACGRCKESPFGQDLVQKARAILSDELQRRGESEAKDTPDPQHTILLRELGMLLRQVGDPDWRILADAENSFLTGVPLGVKERLPRTPAVFERKVKHRKYDDDLEEGHPESRENYKSLDGKVADIEAQFERERGDHMMRLVTDAEARDEYGEDLVTAALGAIRKSETSFRVIHDGTHGVRVNPRILPRDQMRMPGMPEQRTILGLARRAGGVHFGLVGDVSKAHRRCRVRRIDHGFQACRLRAGQVWLNEVGTFGIVSAAYWWSRLAAAICRSTLYLMFNNCYWQLLYSDDYSWEASGGNMFTDLLLGVFWQVTLGVQFSWPKFRGGLQADWIGFWMDYERFAVGLNEKRREWLVGWLQGMLHEEFVLVQNVADGLGRLSFSTLAVPEVKPFLGPFFAWCSATPAGAYVELPIMLRIIAKFLIAQIQANRFLHECHVEEEGGPEECFRADAKAEGDDVGVGGWECRGDTPPSQARWFAVKVTRTNCPWVFARGEPFRVIASLELLGTLLCWLAFGRDASPKGPGMSFSGSTDNKGNAHVIDRLLTTKFPLCAILMELSAQLSRAGASLTLDWIPRLQNTEADELSNGITTSFQEVNRVHLDLGNLDLLILPELIGYG